MNTKFKNLNIKNIIKVILTIKKSVSIFLSHMLPFILVRIFNLSLLYIIYVCINKVNIILSKSNYKNIENNEFK